MGNIKGGCIAIFWTLWVVGCYFVLDLDPRRMADTSTYALLLATPIWAWSLGKVLAAHGTSWSIKTVAIIAVLSNLAYVGAAGVWLLFAARAPSYLHF